VQAAIGDRARVHPRAEHCVDRAPQLLARVLRERLATFLLDPLFVALDERNPVVGGEVGVEAVALALLVFVEDFLEQIMRDA